MTMTLNGFERWLCDIQGRLFERSLTKNLDSQDFIEKFMNSKTCEHLDMSYDRLQWAGEEYILEDLLDEVHVRPAGECYDKERLYWAGYIYRYWHFLTGESGRDILKQAQARRMRDCYIGFHTLDAAMAIDDLKEVHRQETATT